jgi:phosphoribosyl-ATP pyrophosphohydrolase
MAKPPPDIPSEPLARLYAAIEASRGGDPTKSYTARLFSRGRAKIAQKLGEEAIEVVIETIRGDRTALVGESADLLYHLLVAWSDAGIKPAEVWAELARREGISGIAEKNARKAG